MLEGPADTATSGSPASKLDLSRQPYSTPWLFRTAPRPRNRAITSMSSCLSLHPCSISCFSGSFQPHILASCCIALAYWGVIEPVDGKHSEDGDICVYGLSHFFQFST